MPRTSSTTAHLSRVVLLALAAGAQAVPRSASADAAAKPPPVTSNRPVVLLAPGRSPFAPLRFTLSKTAVEKGELSFTTSMAIETAAGPKKIDLPGMTASLTATNAAATGADSVTVNVKFGALHVSGPNAHAVEAKMHDAGINFEGLGYGYVITNRGLITSSSITAAPDVAPAFRQQLAEQSKSALDGTLLPFPAEPVGVGARWQQATTRQYAEMIMVLTTTYELLERSKTFVRVKRSVVATAEPGLVSIPGKAAKLEVLTGEGSGTGELLQPFDQVMPSSWTYSLQINMSFKAQGQTFKQTVTVDATGGDKLAKN